MMRRAVLLYSFVFAVLAAAPNQTYTGETDVIYSPNYPDNYNNNLHYYVTITVQPGYYVHLTLLDFETEPCCDKLYVWDGVNLAEQTIANVSGTKTGLEYSSSGSQMTLMFSTDLTGTARGFAIRYEQVKINTQVEVTNQCSPTIQTSVTGFVTSPNWPQNYPNSVTCSYKLTSTKAKVMLTFVAFSTEPCCDKVVIYDGPDAKSPVLASLAGSSLPNGSYTSSGTDMFLSFSSDFTNNFAGFSAFFVAVDTTQRRTQIN